MSEQTQQIIDRIPANYRKNCIERLTDRIGVLSDGDLKNLFIESIGKALYIAGKKTKEDTESLQQELLLMGELLKEKFREPQYEMVPCGIIRRAIEKGAFGEYGEVYGVTCNEIVSWVNAFLSSDEYVNSIKAYDKALDESVPKSNKPILTWATFCDSLEKVFDEYKSTGSMPFTASFYYNGILKALNVKTLVNDPETRKLIAERSKIKYETERLRGKVNSTSLKRILENLATDPTYMGICQSFCLKWYFDDIIRSGKHINDYVASVKSNIPISGDFLKKD